MIDSAEEFLRLRNSSALDEQRRASTEAAADSVWLEVIRDYPEMREWVAHNKTVKAEILGILARDADERVRAVVARRRVIPVSLLQELARDASSSVRQAVATHHKATIEILRLLAADPEDHVRELAERRLKPDP